MNMNKHRPLICSCAAVIFLACNPQPVRVNASDIVGAFAGPCLQGQCRIDFRKDGSLAINFGGDEETGTWTLAQVSDGTYVTLTRHPKGSLADVEMSTFFTEKRGHIALVMTVHNDLLVKQR
jgi:hypothetical protein